MAKKTFEVMLSCIEKGNKMSKILNYDEMKYTLGGMILSITDSLISDEVHDYTDEYIVTMQEVCGLLSKARVLVEKAEDLDPVAAILSTIAKRFGEYVEEQGLPAEIADGTDEIVEKIDAIVSKDIEKDTKDIEADLEELFEMMSVDGK